MKENPKYTKYWESYPKITREEIENRIEYNWLDETNKSRLMDSVFKTEIEKIRVESIEKFHQETGEYHLLFMFGTILKIDPLTKKCCDTGIFAED